MILKGKLYVIRNKINSKMYVGKTYSSISGRFRKHILDSKKEKCKDRPLYRAFNKYGTINFEIICIGEFNEGDLELAEMHYIELFNTYKNGYNATLGGDGKCYIDYTQEELVTLYSECGMSIVRLSEITGINDRTLRLYLNEFGIDTSNFDRKEGNPLKCIDTFKVKLLYFISMQEAVRYIMKKGDNEKSLHNQIRKVIDTNKTFRNCKFSSITVEEYHANKDKKDVVKGFDPLDFFI